MDNIYKRTENIDEKIHSVKLPYIAWKVLFLVNGEISIKEIVSLLDEDAALVEEALQKLSAEELVLATEQAEIPVEEIPEKPDTQAELKPEPEAPEEIEEKEVYPAEEILEEAAPLTEDAPVEDAKLESEPIAEEVTATEDLDETGLDLDVDFTEDLDLEEDRMLEPEVTPKPAAIETPPEEPKVETEVQGGQKTILVIDDSIVIRKMVEIALEDENYNIQTAVSGKEGLDKIDQINPDLVILDLMLPDISGIDILKTIKAAKGIPVIMLSGKDSPQMVENAKSEGADAFLPKPFKDDELVEKIKSLVQ